MAAEPVYNIEKILDRRVEKKKVQYLVKWENFPESEATWEPAANLRTSCYELVTNFEQKRLGGPNGESGNGNENSGENSEEDEDTCRACNPANPAHDSYPDKKPRNGEYDPTLVWCDRCNHCYHNSCVGLQKYLVDYIENYYCPECEDQNEITYKTPIAFHRLKFDDKKELKNKKMEVGSKNWIEQFITTEESRFQPAPSTHVVQCKNGKEFLAAFKNDPDWKKVYLIADMAGLEMKMPARGKFAVDDVINIFGGGHVITPTVDVYRQKVTEMAIGTYQEKLSSNDRPFLYNILSLEFSKNGLTKYVTPPAIANELSWVNNLWSDKVPVKSRRDDAHDSIKPQLESFCLLGMAGSYTNYHIDAGGSSVWYHVYEGAKIFYIVEPTTDNLTIFEKHHQNPKKDEIFLGDLYKENCWRVLIPAGTTLMLPAGWIHSVYTPVDSIVFGGNFLTDMHVHMQCQVFGFETRNATPTYDNFKTINFYTARRFTETLKTHQKQKSTPSTSTLQGAKALIDSMENWLAVDRSKGDMFDITFITTEDDEPFIHGETQRSILKNLKSAFNKFKVNLAVPEGRFAVSEESTASTSKSTSAKKTKGEKTAAKTAETEPAAKRSKKSK